MSAGGTRTLVFRLRNSSPWLDLCPLVRARPDGVENVRCTLDGQDVSADVLSKGVACIGARRLWPQTTHELRMTITAVTAPGRLQVEMLPHPSAEPDDVRQKLGFSLLPTVVVKR